MGYNWQQLIMKKLMYGLSIVLLFTGMTFMSSCKPEKKISGKWKVVYSKQDGFTDEYNIGEIWTFKENGKFLGAFFEDETIECDYSFDGKTLTFFGGDLKYDINIGETINKSYNYTVSLDVDELSKKKMSLSGKVTEKYYDYNIFEDFIDTWSVIYELEKIK